MYRYRKNIFLFFSSIILCVITSCFAGVVQQSADAVDRTDGYTSNLPIVIIRTSGQRIYDDPKVPARIKIIYDESGGRNSLDSPHIQF